MTRTLTDFPVGITALWKVGDDPSSTTIMLMLREGFGHHTEILDAADFDAWLTEHHPEVYTAGGDGKRSIDLTALPPDILAPCLKHARARKWDRTPGALKGLEFGHLVDARHPHMSYYVNHLAGWQPGVGVAVVKDGQVGIQVIPVEPNGARAGEDSRP